MVRCIVFIYFITAGVFFSFAFNRKKMFETTFSRNILIVSAISAVLALSLSIYMVDMGFKHLSLLRSHGHIQGYVGEIFIVICFVI